MSGQWEQWEVMLMGKWIPCQLVKRSERTSLVNVVAPDGQPKTVYVPNDNLRHVVDT